MGIQVEFWRGGERIRGLPDPAGGVFDAAGDFDRLLGEWAHRFPLLGAVDPCGETSFGPERMAGLLAEIDVLAEQARDDVARRGLMRLRVMAQRCGDVSERLVFVGD
ncbi:hypothetical protein [Actinoplanes couchii]|uniref:Uncharacterized protein n=1 Tax=Actinoplanes couchii TaxID=403638 RepID=A0ABQ3X8A4_9ACTN|nr:hypothetical protein [Actinoplanes couchii]MDR6320341.1 hypothetical protein [Actinoplanes couchii]GID54645.1 hypothetical protein Aco03nite_030490 [Actinoplanes couchii]